MYVLFQVYKTIYYKNKESKDYKRLLFGVFTVNDEHIRQT